MAISKIKIHRFIRTLVNDVFTHAELMLRNGAEGYKLFEAEAAALEAGAGTPEQIAAKRSEALFHLRHGVAAPQRIDFRIQKKVAKLISKFGTPALAASYIDNALLYYGIDATRQEILDHINSLTAISATVINGRLNLGWTLDQMADYIIANTENDEDLYAFEDTGYVQEWNEGG